MQDVADEVQSSDLAWDGCAVDDEGRDDDVCDLVRSILAWCILDDDVENEPRQPLRHAQD